MLQIFLNWGIPFLCGGVISVITALVQRTNRRERAERDGIECLLRAEIIRQHDKCSEKGYCPLYVKELAQKAYSAYHSLGGNGVITNIYEEILKMPERREK